MWAFAESPTAELTLVNEISYSSCVGRCTITHNGLPRGVGRVASRLSCASGEQEPIRLPALVMRRLLIFANRTLRHTIFYQIQACAQSNSLAITPTTNPGSLGNSVICKANCLTFV